MGCSVWEACRFPYIKPFQSARSAPVSRELNFLGVVPPTSPLKATASVILTCGQVILITLVGSIFETQRFLVLRLKQRGKQCCLPLSPIKELLAWETSHFHFGDDGSGREANNTYVGVNEKGTKRDVLFNLDKAIVENKILNNPLQKLKRKNNFRIIL